MLPGAENPVVSPGTSLPSLLPLPEKGFNTFFGGRYLSPIRFCTRILTGCPFFARSSAGTFPSFRSFRNSVLLGSLSFLKGPSSTLKPSSQMVRVYESCSTVQTHQKKKKNKEAKKKKEAHLLHLHIFLHALQRCLESGEATSLLLLLLSSLRCGLLISVTEFVAAALEDLGFLCNDRSGLLLPLLLSILVCGFQNVFNRLSGWRVLSWGTLQGDPAGLAPSKVFLSFFFITVVVIIILQISQRRNPRIALGFLFSASTKETQKDFSRKNKQKCGHKGLTVASWRQKPEEGELNPRLGEEEWRSKASGVVAGERKKVKSIQELGSFRKKKKS